MKFFILLSVAIALTAGAPVDESDKKEKRGLVEIGHNFGYEEPSLYDNHHDDWTDHHVTKHVTVQKNVAVPYPVEVEKHVPVAVKVPVPVHVEKQVPVYVEKKVPVYVEKKVHVPVDRPVPYPVKVNVPVYHKEVVEVAKPYPVHVEKPYPVYVKQPVYVKDHHYSHKPYWG
ncbi:uncharacterized protein LOC131693848 [Topomyia yanbarensis]|uniref:uncharacterized protein LOC131693848 n=1 Tax=Topomyia yanbarensis TaxID=2498891 RepID=UPI00273BC7B7|nr:uncharacterized protein LOC131693848 [Topomyia yanbarensis]